MMRNALVITTTSIKADDAVREKSSKVDVYDYAAQFDTLPVFETIRMPGTAQPHAKEGYLCRVSVPGTNIVGEGFHPNFREYAEIGACVNFKKRAEELHQGEKMLVKHINTLTSKTGQKFLQYCKMKHKNWEQFVFTAKQVNGFAIHGQLHWGSRLLSECTMFKYPNSNHTLMKQNGCRSNLLLPRRQRYESPGYKDVEEFRHLHS